MVPLAAPCVIDAVPTPDGMRLAVEGEIDMFTAGHLEAALAGAHADGDVVLDLRACGFMDASGAHAIGRARRRLGGRLRVVTEPGSVPARVLELLGDGR